MGNKNNLTVNCKGKWKLYQSAKIPDWEILGTVTIGADDTGALVRNIESGQYAKANAGIIRNLDGRKVAAALGITGRPPEMDGGRRVNVYLDARSLEIASTLGSGNVSEGIRKALGKTK